MAKTVKDIKVPDQILISNTGFIYVVTYITELSIKVNRSGNDYWIPKSLIEISDSKLSTHGYRLFILKELPEWFIMKNGIN
jgi:hypothetical protein